MPDSRGTNGYTLDTSNVYRVTWHDRIIIGEAGKAVHPYSEGSQ